MPDTAHATTEPVAATELYASGMAPSVETTPLMSAPPSSRVATRDRPRHVFTLAVIVAVLVLLIVAGRLLASQLGSAIDPPTTSQTSTSAPTTASTLPTTTTDAAPAQPPPPDNGGKGKPARGKGNKD
jgi:hypothetical protein